MCASIVTWSGSAVFYIFFVFEKEAMARPGPSLDAASAALGEPLRPDPAHLLPHDPSLIRLTASCPLCRVLVTLRAYWALRVVLSGRRASLSWRPPSWSQAGARGSRDQQGARDSRSARWLLLGVKPARKEGDIITRKVGGQCEPRAQHETRNNFDYAFPASAVMSIFLRTDCQCKEYASPTADAEIIGSSR